MDSKILCNINKQDKTL